MRYRWNGLAPGSGPGGNSQNDLSHHTGDHRGNDQHCDSQPGLSDRFFGITFLLWAVGLLGITSTI